LAFLDDSVTLALLAAAAFFVALSFGLLLRYRQVSQRMAASSDLGHDLWDALERRMKKQDERILDMMGRLEVVQSRVIAVATQAPPVIVQPVTLPTTSEEKPRDVKERTAAVQQPESQAESHISQGSSREVRLDETQVTAIRLLGDSPKNTRQLTDALNKSREHTARIMKELFELGLVSRNDSTKPFVYQLTDEGRRNLKVNGETSTSAAST
jgi:CRP-like cAMP-binding protein